MLYAASLLALALVTCCTKSTPTGASLRSLVLDATVAFNSAETKAITNPTDDYKKLPPAYSIYTSAYYTDPEFPSTDGNYFTGVKFDYDSALEGWKPASASEFFWPIAGNGNSLDFLAVATDTSSLDISDKMLWAGQDDSFLQGERSVHGVRINVPDNDGSAEILYARASRQCNDKTPVQMVFRHTQCCLEFNIRMQVNLDNMLRLDRIVVEDAYSSGECTIKMHPIENASWNLETSKPHSKEVPGIAEGTSVTKTEALTYNVVLPPQPGCVIAFHFRQRSSDVGSGNGVQTEITPVYRIAPDATTWEAGKKYIFDVTVKPGEIAIVPRVTEWKVGKNIVVPV